MKKIVSLFCVLAYVVSFLFAMPLAASAASTNSQDGIEVAISTDKDSYAKDEEIALLISIKNTNPYPVTGVSIETVLPEGLNIKQGSVNFENITIPADDAYQTSVTYLEEVPEATEPAVTEPGEIPVVPGDLDGNDVVDEDDVIYLLQHLLMPEDFQVTQSVDYDRNGTIDEDDVIYLLQHLLMSEEFPLLLSGLPADTFALEEDAATITVDKTITVDATEYTIETNVVIPKESLIPNCTVTFDTNGGSPIASQELRRGDAATEPEDPTRSGYAFRGWYTDNKTFDNPYAFSSAVTANLTLYAKWVEVQEDVISRREEAVSTFAILDLLVDTTSNTITAKVSAPDNCAVIVRFVEEEAYFGEDFANKRTYINDGNTYASHVVPAQSDMLTITATINNSLPENFVAEAVLIDAQGEELCDPYTSIAHTERYGAYASKTVYDFGEDNLVLNFDESLDNNFGVLADDVKVVTATDVHAEDTDQDGVEDCYKITNPSDELLVLDKVFISDNDSDHIFKIQSIETSGAEFTIYPVKANDETNGFDMDDFYKFLKVNMTYESDENVQSQQEPESVATRTSRKTRGLNIWNVYETASGKAEFMFPITFHTDHFQADAKVGATLSAELVFEWDTVLFGEDYMRFDFTYEVDGTAELEVVAKFGTENDEEREEMLKNLKEERELKLGKIRIPFGVTGIDAFADIKLCVEWKITAGLKAEGTYKTISGFKYNTNDGRQNIDSKESSWTIHCEGHAEIEFGPKPSVGVELLGGVVSCELECFMGLKAEADAVIPIVQGGDHIHGCNLCIDGKVSAVVVVDAKLEYHITEHLEGTPIDINLITLEKKLFDFFISLLNDSNSVYGGQVKFGFGDCENKIYKTTIHTYDAENRPCEVTVDIFKQDNNEMVTSIAGGTSTYLAPGSYVAKAIINEHDAEMAFVVTDGAKVITLTEAVVPSTHSQVSGTVTEAVSATGLADVQIKIYENTTCVAESVTDSNGQFVIQLNQGSYRLELVKTGYVPVTQSFVIRENEQKELGAIGLVEQNDSSIMGGIYGYINDALTGYAVSGVQIKISQGWNADPSAPYVAEATTNENGSYSHNKTTIMGVDFGLNAGNYTVTISKEGYITTTFNVTIVGGQDMEFNSTITPVGTGDVFHIVLTWGKNPLDLDSHFNGSYEDGHDHVYYSDKEGAYSNLDVDDVTSYGPETITITEFDCYTGDVMYSVHDYTNRYSDNSTGLALSGAVVKVYRSGQLLETFNVPADKQGTLWNVFYIDPLGNIKAVNTFENEYDPYDITGSNQVA